jgi:uncharacterized protein YfiM (DUF2279 family)
LFNKLVIIAFIFLGFIQDSTAQLDTLNKKRLTTVIAVEAAGYTGIMTGLYYLWYKDAPSQGFHTLNDNTSWEQMDKAGHTMTSYYVGRAGYEVLRWSGVNEKKSIFYGGTVGLFFLTSVEILDGFSASWGYSWGDVGANTLGTGLFIGQQLAWKEQRLTLKFSYHNTEYAQLRPKLLGETLVQRSIKDYNGQTYWASANIASFLGEDTKFPKWMNLAVGYGADGMVGSIENVTHPEIERTRQYYVSLDVDLTKIKTKSKFFNTVLGAFGFLKFPLPAIEFNSGGTTKFHAIYF